MLFAAVPGWVCLHCPVLHSHLDLLSFLLAHSRDPAASPGLDLQKCLAGRDFIPFESTSHAMLGWFLRVLCCRG